MCPLRPRKSSSQYIPGYKSFDAAVASGWFYAVRQCVIPTRPMFQEPRGRELRAVVSVKRFPFPQMESIHSQFGADSIHKAKSLPADATNANCCPLWNQCVSGVGGSKISIGALCICSGSVCAWSLSGERASTKRAETITQKNRGKESRALTSYSANFPA